MNILQVQRAVTDSCSVSFLDPAQRALSRLLLVATAVFAVSACSTQASCADPKAPYLKASSHAALQIPEGLSSPDRSSALIVPPPPVQTTAMRGSSDARRCLDSPPSYFSGPGTPSAAPEEVVAAWGQAWANQDVAGVMATYSKGFLAPTSAGSEQWLEQRREQVGTGAAPNARLEDLKVVAQDDRRVVTFVQRFGEHAVRKELTLVKENGIWRILTEQAVDLQ